jgi:hypothetical protein
MNMSIAKQRFGKKEYAEKDKYPTVEEIGSSFPLIGCVPDLHSEGQRENPHTNKTATV